MSHKFYFLLLSLVNDKMDNKNLQNNNNDKDNNSHHNNNNI